MSDNVIDLTLDDGWGYYENNNKPAPAITEYEYPILFEGAVPSCVDVVCMETSLKGFKRVFFSNACDFNKSILSSDKQIAFIIRPVNLWSKT